MKIQSISCFILLLIDFSGAEYCSEDFSLTELPRGPFRHVVGTVMQYIKLSLWGCSKPSINTNHVSFLLYTRNNSDIPIRLDPKNPIEINPKKPIKILMPGWLCSLSNSRMPELKDAYLRRYDANVIGVDWSIIAMDLYPTVFCKLPAVGKIVGDFLCDLSNNLNVDLKEIHLVGHSLGAHLAGFAGQEVQLMCKKKIGRITGLDPAGPFFVGIEQSGRLDASDAEFVDVIHTNMGTFGYTGTCGTVDFFVNYGSIQPDCVLQTYGSFINRIKIIAACSHLRALDYMVHSIESKDFTARSCQLCPYLWFVNPFSSKIKMGEDCPRNPPHRKYALFTNNIPRIEGEIYHQSQLDILHPGSYY